MVMCYVPLSHELVWNWILQRRSSSSFDSQGGRKISEYSNCERDDQLETGQKSSNLKEQLELWTVLPLFGVPMFWGSPFLGYYNLELGVLDSWVLRRQLIKMDSIINWAIWMFKKNIITPSYITRPKHRSPNHLTPKYETPNIGKPQKGGTPKKGVILWTTLIIRQTKYR